MTDRDLVTGLDGAATAASALANLPGPVGGVARVMASLLGLGAGLARGGNDAEQIVGHIESLRDALAAPRDELLAEIDRVRPT